MRLFDIKARKFVGLAVLLFFTVPFGLSVTGCGHKAAAVVFCNSGDTGPVVGQLATIQLQPSLAIVGESLNYGQIGAGLTATGSDCKGTTVSTSSVTYGTSDPTIADVNPKTGSVCGGTWNRNTGGGVQDFTTCNLPAGTPSKFMAFITATGNGIASNALPVYIHPTITSIVFGESSARSCPAGAPVDSLVDPDTTCCPTDPTTVVTGVASYNGTSCISQGGIGQIAARIYANNTTNPADNITCKSGHIRFGTQGAANIVSIDQNGVVTANLPGSVAITAALSNSSSGNSIGFFSTCPPTQITLTAVGQSGPSITVPLHNSQPVIATATDQFGHSITGLQLEYNSTTPENIPGGISVTPTFPGTAEITAVCQPPTCNPAPYSQIGYLGNGKPVTSSGLSVTATGSSSTLLYIASTNSQYLLPIDFTTNVSTTPIKLPYVPNSMVLSQDGSELYLGSSTGLMTLSTATNQLTSTNAQIPGTVISVSPAGSNVVVTDPLRQTISLVASGGTSVNTATEGIATHASWSPDSQTVYITTTGNNILTYSTNTNWQSTILPPPPGDVTYNDVAVLQPSVGAYFAGNTTTDGRSYCYTSHNLGGGAPPTEDNDFAPIADQATAHIDRISTTTDGKHVLGASIATGISDIFLTSLPADCTTVDIGTERSAVKFGSTTRSFAFAGITPSVADPNDPNPLKGLYTGITGVLPSSNSAIAFITYAGTGSKLPYYLPVATGNAGTLSYFPLTGGAIAPVAGVFTSDDSTFFVGTSGDDKVHQLTITYPGGAPVITDTNEITPALPAVSGTDPFATPNLIAQHPKATKS